MIALHFRYMVDGKAVNRKSLAPDKSKGKRLSLMTSSTPTKRDEQEDEPDDGDSSVPSTPDVSGKFSPPRRPFQAISPLDRDFSNSGSASGIPSGQSSPLVRYSAVYPSVSAKARKAQAENESTPLDGSEPASSPSSSAFVSPNPGANTSSPIPAEVAARIPLSKPAPPPPAQKAASPPPPPTAAIAPAVPPPTPKAPSAAPVEAAVETGRDSLSKPDKPPKPDRLSFSRVLSAVIGTGQPPASAPDSTAVPVPVPAAVAPPPPPLPVAVSAALSQPTPPPPPRVSIVTPPPPPAAPAAPPAPATDSTASTPTPKAPAAATDNDDDSDSDFEDAEEGLSPSIPTPVVAPVAPRSHYLEDIMSGAASASSDVLTMMMGGARRPPAPPPPPPAGLNTPGKLDTTPSKTLLKPRPVSQNMNASSNRLSMRLNSADSISSQLNAFALSFAGTVPDEMEVVPEHPQEDEIDVFAAVNSVQSSFAPPPPLPVCYSCCPNMLFMSLLIYVIVASCSSRPPPSGA